jgi:hypothetical protein
MIENSGRIRKIRCWLRVCGSFVWGVIIRVWTSCRNAAMSASTLTPKSIPGIRNRISGRWASRSPSQATVGLMHGTFGSPGVWQAMSIRGWPNTWSIELMSGAESPCETT